MPFSADPNYWDPDKALDRVRELPRIQISHTLPRDYLAALKEASRQYPEKELHVFGKAMEGSLEELEGFEHVQSLLIDIYEATSFEVLSGFTNLRRIGIGATRSTRPSMGFLVNCPRIEQAWLKGKDKGLDAVAELHQLELLRLENLRAKTVDFLSDHPSLERLEILSAGVTTLEALGSVPRLSRVWVGRIRGLKGQHLAPLSDSSIDMLALNDAAGIEDLAPLGRFQVRHLSVDNLPNLRTLNPLSGWPSLEVLGIRNAVPSDESLVNVARIPTLQHLAIADSVSRVDLRAVQAVFRGKSLWFRGEYVWGTDRPPDIIAERDQV